MHMHMHNRKMLRVPIIIAFNYRKWVKYQIRTISIRTVVIIVVIVVIIAEGIQLEVLEVLKAKTIPNRTTTTTTTAAKTTTTTIRIRKDIALELEIRIKA